MKCITKNYQYDECESVKPLYRCYYCFHKKNREIYFYNLNDLYNHIKTHLGEE